jgi:hypothetical protein
MGSSAIHGHDEKGKSLNSSRTQYALDIHPRGETFPQSRKGTFFNQSSKGTKKNLHLDSTQKKVFSFVFWIFANGETVAPADREPLLIRWPGFLASPLPLAS